MNYKFYQLLQRIRKGKVTIQDYKTLCSRIMTKEMYEADPKWKHSTIITARNSVRSLINQCELLEYARQRGVRPIIWRAQDYTADGKYVIPGGKLQQLIEKMPDSKTRGLPYEFIFVPGAKYLHTTNTSTELGWTNGAEGIATTIVLDENKPPEEDENPTQPRILQYPPLYVLFELLNPQHQPLEGLEPKVVPVRPTEFSFRVRIICFLCCSFDLLHISGHLVCRLSKICVHQAFTDSTGSCLFGYRL
jgi:hypothetical protein